MLYEPLHSPLVVIGSILDAFRDEITLCPAPQPLDGHEGGAVCTVENQFNLQFRRQIFYNFHPVNTKVVKQQDSFLSTNCSFELVQELLECIAVNALLTKKVRNDLAGSVYGGSYCDCFEPNLLFIEKNRTRLRNIPNFWFDLTTTEHRLVHVVDVLLVVKRLEKTSEAIHTALMLSF